MRTVVQLLFRGIVTSSDGSGTIVPTADWVEFPLSGTVVQLDAMSTTTFHVVVKYTDPQDVPQPGIYTTGLTLVAFRKGDDPSTWHRVCCRDVVYMSAPIPPSSHVQLTCLALVSMVSYFGICAADLRRAVDSRRISISLRAQEGQAFTGTTRMFLSTVSAHTRLQPSSVCRLANDCNGTVCRRFTARTWLVDMLPTTTASPSLAGCGSVTTDSSLPRSTLSFASLSTLETSSARPSAPVARGVTRLLL
jgi:hypothetical protein